MTAANIRVAVALSGGVDSAVAAALLKAQGFQVEGVHLRLWGRPPQEHLQALARELGILLREVDLREDFARQVVDYFVTEYCRGRTPNPCVACNAAIKFGRLLAEVRAQGAHFLATGHYARLLPAPDGAPGLYRGADRSKDQSYFLSRVPREVLPYLLFPLGEMTKAQVKARHREMGLPAGPDCRESMELCFVPGDRYQEFLRGREGFHDSPGDLVDTGGKYLGRHRGLVHYTVGQRRGLGVTSRQPYYVVELRPETNRVVLGRQADLLSRGLKASRVNWLIGPPAGELEAVAVIRYRHPGGLAQITPTGEAEVEVIFQEPQAAVTPGQAVIFYQGDRVLGGGWIEERIR
jgi:tRNA-specific 2-thiouridylase